MKKITLLFLLLNVSFLCTKEISGVVKTLLGTSRSKHRRKGTQNGVSTNMDGAYKIKVKQGARSFLVTLVFQCGKSNNSFYNKCSFV
jgi:iron complex outermembrane receptor protein